MGNFLDNGLLKGNHPEDFRRELIMNEMMDLEEYSKKAEQIVSSVGIPTQPAVLMEVNKAANDPDSDLTTISEIISKDVAMSAKVLKVANSAFFGLRQSVDSIDRALAMLGMNNFKKIILSSSLKETLGSKGPGIERFWSHSMTTASVASYIAEKAGLESPDQAYTAGLFHDCGIPLLMKKYKDYGELIDYALSVVSSDALSGKTKSIIGIEDERYGTHHCAVGYIIAKSWNLSTSVHQAIWYHHYVHIDIHVNEETKRLSAILLLADYISSHLLFLSGGTCTVEAEAEWVESHTLILSELGLTIDDIKDMREDLTEKLVSPA